MKHNSLFYTNLRKVYLDHEQSSKLRSKMMANSLFCENHFSEAKKDKRTKNFISHRCSQWLSDLGSADRNQSLLIEDLELACDCFGEPASVLLNDPRYWKSNIDYVNEEFLDILKELNKTPQNSNTLENAFFPIRFNPKANTFLAGVIVAADTGLNKRITLANPLMQKDKLLEIRYVVYTLHSIIEAFGQNLPEDKTQCPPLTFSNYQSALSHFNSYSEQELGAHGATGLGFQIENMLRKIKYHSENRINLKMPWKDVAKTLKKQKLLRGFFSELLNQFVPEIPTHTNVKKNSLENAIMAGNA